MATSAIRREAPSSAEELAAALAGAGERGESVRVRGGGTKFAWGGAVDEPALLLSTEKLDRVLEHNAGDMTAIVEAGIPLVRAQEAFAAEGQMLALDPPDHGSATLGGVVAAADSGPLRYRYGAPRDLVLGIRVALSDGTLAQAGGKVIKNVAGYDLSKLFAGSFGTLGAIVQVAVRLHPLPPATATALGTSPDPDALATAAAALSHARIEQDALDVHWLDGRGTVLSRFAGATATAQAKHAATLLHEAGLHADVVDADASLWDAQRDAQRSAEGTVVRVSALQSQLADVLREAERLGAPLVGRAGLGLSWLRLEDRSPSDVVAAVAELRAQLSPAPCAVLDAPAEVRVALDPWGGIDPGTLALMRRVKERFDPAGVCAPGVLG
jgi:glycolate oxidase FAD binding subunit